MLVPLEGPVSVGALVDAILLGCVFVQSCVYYKSPRHDAWLLKVLVSLILFFSLSHFGCLVTWLCATTQVNTDDGSVPGYTTILMGVSTVLGVTVLFLERCFFSCRIMKASHNNLLGFLFLTVCIVSFMVALGAASTFFVNVTTDLTSQLTTGWILPLAIVLGLICDLAISVMTAFYLKSRMLTEVASPYKRVAWLFLLVAETGSVTSLIDIATIIVYWLTKANLAWVGLLISMPGVFANSLLVALNVGGHLCTDIEHQRTYQIADKFIDVHPQKPPITIQAFKRVQKQPEENSV